MPDSDKRLETIELKLDDIIHALSQIAVQQEKITRLETSMDNIWKRYDGIVGPGGIIPKIREYQASCPRAQIRWMWAILIPMGVSLLGISVTLLRGAP